MSSSQSQGHGFFWENNVREEVFGLPSEKNDVCVHDISKENNPHNKNENCSIKAVGGSTIYCGDLLRFYNYDFDEKNTIIVIKYIQIGDSKKIENVYEIEYNEACHKMLFGNIPKHDLENYVNGVKSIPAKCGGENALKIFDYKTQKNALLENYKNIKAIINPKVDSSQSRVQCSVKLSDMKEFDFIKYDSLSVTGKPNILRGKELVVSIESPKRKRGGMRLDDLKNICKDNNIAGYTKKNKNELVDLLTSKQLI
jgi:hypothetical protein|tara:strand:- start:950 stop:1714 length:765 start_codon:yes stop_codon:yes gene_type:complete